MQRMAYEWAVSALHCESLVLALETRIYTHTHTHTRTQARAPFKSCLCMIVRRERVSVRLQGSLVKIMCPPGANDRFSCVCVCENVWQLGKSSLCVPFTMTLCTVTASAKWNLDNGFQIYKQSVLYTEVQGQDQLQLAVGSFT